MSQVPFNWELDELDPGYDISLQPDENNYSEGLRSCRLKLMSSLVPYLISDVFYVTPGSDYEFSIDVLDQDTAGMLRIYADFYDAYGFDLFGKAPMNSTDSANWQNISWTGTVPPQAVVGYILVKYFCQPNPDDFIRESMAWIDNARFSESGGENLVVNGGFESWTTSIQDFRSNPMVLTIFPNPADSYTYIYHSSTSSKIAFFDVFGRKILIFENPSDEQTFVPLSGLAEGIYFIKVTSLSGEEKISKLIVKR